MSSYPGQGIVGGRGNVLELSAIHSTHTRQIAFDDIAFHSPYSVFVSTDRTIVLFANISQMSILTIYMGENDKRQYALFLRWIGQSILEIGIKPPQNTGEAGGQWLSPIDIAP